MTYPSLTARTRTYSIYKGDRLCSGRSHDENYELWAKGTIADSGFKEFVQDGRTELLEKRESQGFNGIFDTFTGIPVTTGEGNTETDFFLNQNHTKVFLE